jgi:hypothetical protein
LKPTLPPVDRNAVVALAESTARLYLIAEVSYYRRELDARRLGGDRLVARVAQARDLAQDFGEMLCFNAVQLDRVGLSALGRSLLDETFRKLCRGRKALALGEYYSGRKAPEIPFAYETPGPRGRGGREESTTR